MAETTNTRPADRLPIQQNGKFCYDIVYAADPAVLCDEMEAAGLLQERLLIITDTNVAPLYGELFARKLGDRLSAVSDRPSLRPLSGIRDVPVYAIPAGEENKNLDQIRNIYRFLIENHYDRKTCLIALGGGVVGDMTGFAAATYMRGVDYVQIPTTLLAQADSSIGGKTGVDFEGYKNMVGAFKMPRLVFADVALLQSLDERQFSSGFAEVMKHALIKDENYYTWLLDHMEEINARDPAVLHQMLLRSNEIKKEVVEHDPFEKGERMLLNFGHTIGHAIEKYKNFTLTHGQCVALGCVAAAYISYRRKLLSWEEYYEIRDMFVPFGLSITETGLDHQEILRLTKSDKKVQNGQVRFVLLRGIGEAFVDTSVTDEEILAAINEIDWDAKGAE